MGAGQSAENLVRQYGLLDVPGDPRQRTPEQEARVQRAKRDVLAWSTPVQELGAKANEYMERSLQRQLEAHANTILKARYADSARRAAQVDAVRTNFANQFAATELHGGGDLLQAGSFVAFAFPPASDSRDRDRAKRSRADRLLYLSADDFSALQRYCETATVLLGADVGVSDTRQRMLAAGQSDDAPTDRDEHGNAVVRLPARATRWMTYEGLRDLVELARFGEVQTRFATRLSETAHFLMCPDLRLDIMRCPVVFEQLTTETLWLTNQDHTAAEVSLLRDVFANTASAEHRQANILLVADLSDKGEGGRPAIAVCVQEALRRDEEFGFGSQSSFDLISRVYRASIPLPETTDPAARWASPADPATATPFPDAGDIGGAVRLEFARRRREAKVAGGSNAIAHTATNTFRMDDYETLRPLRVRAIGDQRGDPVATFVETVTPLYADGGMSYEAPISVAYATAGHAVAVVQRHGNEFTDLLVQMVPPAREKTRSVNHQIPVRPIDAETALDGSVWEVDRATDSDAWVVSRVTLASPRPLELKLERGDHNALYVGTAAHQSGLMAVVIFRSRSGNGRTALRITLDRDGAALKAEEMILPVAVTENGAAVVDALFVGDLLVLLSVVGGDKISVTTGFVAPVDGHLARFAHR